jgi:hypothetical protein
LISQTLAGYPAGYPAGQFGIRPDTGYQKRPDYPAGYPVHPQYFKLIGNFLKSLNQPGVIHSYLDEFIGYISAGFSCANQLGIIS